MEDESQKWNTDCVYFLASPLTCKKGSECEYRHSESARLNPRDCWYWLGGGCLNPSCAFRHPPFDGRPETSSDPVSLQPSLSASLNKTNVACYFYFNGFCIKGDNCPFLHGPNGMLPTWKLSKTASMNIGANPPENKTSTGSDMGPFSIETPNPAECIAKIVHGETQPPGIVRREAPPVNLTRRSPSPEMSMPEGEGVGKLTESPLSMVNFINGRSLLCLDESSEDHGNNGMEPEEWWESSPGFDVLVDDGTEQLGPEVAEYLDNHLIQYDYADQCGFDSMDYPDAGILYEHAIHDSYNQLEDHDGNYGRTVPGHFRERTVDSMPLEKQKVLARKVFGSNRRSDLDLQDHLCKRRRVNGGQLSRSSGKRSPYGDNWEWPRRHGMHGPIHRKLESEVGRNMIGLYRERGSGLKNNRRGWFRHSQSRHGRFRQQEMERRRHAKSVLLFSEMSRSAAAKEAETKKGSSAFMGPKTLSEIKEEKRRCRGDQDLRNAGRRTYQHLATRRAPMSGNGISEDFQGPKPLSELLKHKNKPRRGDDAGSRQMSTDLGRGHVEAAVLGSEPAPRLTNHFQASLERRPENGHLDGDAAMGRSETSVQLLETEIKFLDDDDDDDEDGLAKKLASIFE